MALAGQRTVRQPVMSHPEPGMDAVIDRGMIRRLARRAAVVLLLALVAACAGEREGSRAVTAGVGAAADTLLQRDAALDRFRRGLAPVESLAPVALERDSLVQRFVRAVEAAETAALGELVLTPAEFAWLYYPTSPQGLPPYDLTADLMWDLLSRQTDRAVLRLLRVSGGRPLGYVAYYCPDEPVVEGDNRIWSPCTITRVRSRGDTVTSRMTGPILERDGRFKFVSLTNDDD
jgi:hypothetical protein